MLIDSTFDNILEVFGNSCYALVAKARRIFVWAVPGIKRLCENALQKKVYAIISVVILRMAKVTCHELQLVVQALRIMLALATNLPLLVAKAKGQRRLFSHGLKPVASQPIVVKKIFEYLYICLGFSHSL